MLLAAGAALALPARARPPRRLPTRGFALPGWVDRRNGVAPAPGVLARLGALGFETIRLPVDPDLVSAPEAGVREEMLARVVDAIGQVIAAGFQAVVDLHPSARLVTAFADDPALASRGVVLAWTYLRDVLARFPADGVFAELLNEPPLARHDWLALRTELAQTIRARCPAHTLIWGPARYQGIWELADDPLLPDGNAIAAVHYYWPMGFTHQCEDWDAAPVGRFSGLPFPATRDAPAARALVAKLKRSGDTAALDALDKEFSRAWSTANIATDFESLAAWSRAHGCPVMLGEFGALGFCADAGSRATWIGTVRKAAEANGAGWIYWEADGGFGFIDDRRTSDGFSNQVIEALLS